MAYTGPNLLPGGIIRNGDRFRTFTESAFTGHVELALSLGSMAGKRFHQGLSSAIALAIECIGEERVTESTVDEMAIGDRQFLARFLGARRLSDEIWISPTCSHCDVRFDLPVRQSLLPVKLAGEEFPTAVFRLSAGMFRCRVPTGKDQMALVATKPSDPRRWLIDRLIEDAPPGYSGADELDGHDIARADAAIEGVSPEVGTVVETTCPSCHNGEQVEVSPYLCLLQGESDLLQQVHEIASTYHWSQREILDLPADRRRRYLTLIDHARGVNA